MVFQSYALYPHLTVAENIAYPLEVRKVDPTQRAEAVLRVARSLEVDHLLDADRASSPAGSASGSPSRRAIIREPAAFLMDEPLSNLDAKLRVTMRAEIKRLQQRLGTTTIYVTHDQVEALTMATGSACSTTVACSSSRRPRRSSTARRTGSSPSSSGTRR